jgi:rod shape-determining protein MreC
MRKKIPTTYFVILLLLLALLSLPRELTEKTRGTVVAFIAPSWQQLIGIKEWFSSSSKDKNDNSPTSLEELQKLQIENKLLRKELIDVKELMQREWHLLNQLSEVSQDSDLLQTASFLKKRHQQLFKKLLNLQLQATPAKIIFRSPASWNSSFWIDLGEHSNLPSGKNIIAKNSPVVVGTSIIGVVDYVGKNQSRVRLITDSGLTPSVRAKRGENENLLLSEKIFSLLLFLEKKNQNLKPLTEQLKAALVNFSTEEESFYLAKGEIQGASKPLWRTCRHLLNGHGFNYDYADGEGPARDLCTGEPIGEEGPSIPILKAGDILVTTGMDGVFPPDLLVAEVLKVKPLKEGDYFYELEAIPFAGNLDDLSLVFVLPPSDYKSEDQPERFL